MIAGYIIINQITKNASTKSPLNIVPFNNKSSKQTKPQKEAAEEESVQGGVKFEQV